MEYSLWNNIRQSLHPASLFFLVLALSVLPAHAQHGGGPDELIHRGQAAGVDAEVLSAIEQRAIANGLDPSQRSQLLAKGVELAEQGLPAAAVMQKTLEGLAKQVPVPMMMSVLDRMQEQTVQAGRIVDGWLQRPDAQRLVAEARSPRGKSVLIENTAEALVHDVPRPTIEAVLDRLPAQAKRSGYSAADVGTALGVLADLPTAKQDADATADLLASALNAGYSQADVRRLPQALRAAEQRGLSAGRAVREVSGAIRRGTPAEEVLSSLFDGEIPGMRAGQGGRGAQGGPPSSSGPPPGVGPDDVGNKGGQGRGNGGGN